MRSFKRLKVFICGMPTIETLAEPSQLPFYSLEGKAVIVIDILRATSTMTTAMWYGVDKIVPFASLEDTKRFAEKQSGVILAGERNGSKVEGFDRGNSPLTYSDADKGKVVAMTTTNGTRCIELSRSAQRQWIGSFLNLTATAEAVKQSGLDVVLFSAGWKNLFNLEDFLFAGALTQLLSENADYQIKDDASLAALSLYKSHSNDLEGILEKASHPQRFKKLGITKDLPFCLQVDLFPKAWEIRDGVISQTH